MNIHFLQTKDVVSKYIFNINDFSSCSFYPCAPRAEDILVTFSPYEKESMRYALIWMLSDRRFVAIQDGVYDICNGFRHPFFKSRYRLYYPSISNVIIAGSACDSEFIQALNPGVDVYSFRLPVSIPSECFYLDWDHMKIFDVLITTANTSYFSESERKLLTSLINETANDLKAEGKSFCFRIFDESLIDSIGEITEKNNIREGCFADTLKLCRCVITTPSTVAIEAMAYDVPVAVLVYRNFPISIQGGWIIRDNASIREVVIDMLSRPGDRMDIQRAIFAKYTNVDYDFLTPELLKDLALKAPSLTDVSYDYSFEMLNSKWNFNLKYFAKRIYYRFFK